MSRFTVADVKGMMGFAQAEPLQGPFTVESVKAMALGLPTDGTAQPMQPLPPDAMMTSTLTGEQVPIFEPPGVAPTLIETAGQLAKATAYGGIRTAAGAVGGGSIAAGEAVSLAPGVPEFLRGSAVAAFGKRLRDPLGLPGIPPVGIENPFEGAGQAEVMRGGQQSADMEPVRTAIVQQGQKVAEQIQLVAEGLGYEPSDGAMGIAEDVAGAIPQLVGSVGAGAAGTLVAGPVGGLASAAAFFALTDAGNQTQAVYDRLLSEGVSEREAASTATAAGTVYGVASGVLEFTGVGTVLGRTGLKRHLLRVAEKRAGKLLAGGARVAGAGITEGLTESAQGVVGDGVMAWARSDWGEFKESWNDLDTRGREFLVGAILGSAVRGGIEVVNPSDYGSLGEMLDAIETEPVAPPEPQATQPPQTATQDAQVPTTGGVVQPSTQPTPVRIVLKDAPVAPQPDQMMPDGTMLFRDRVAADEMVRFRNERLTPEDQRVQAVEVMPGAEGSPWAVVPDTRLEEAQARGEAQSADVTGFAREAGRDRAEIQQSAVGGQPPSEAALPAASPQEKGQTNAVQDAPLAMGHQAAPQTQSEPRQMSANQPSQAPSPESMPTTVTPAEQPDATVKQEVWYPKTRTLNDDLRNLTTDQLRMVHKKNDDPHTRRRAKAILTERGDREPRGPFRNRSKKPPERVVINEAPDDVIRDRYAEADRDLLAAGAVREKDLESGSRYYRMPDGTPVRVSDHEATEATQQWLDRNDGVSIRVEKPGVIRNWRGLLDSLLDSDDVVAEPQKPISEMTRPELLAEAKRLGVMDGPKSNPALRKRVDAARISEKSPLISQETQEAQVRAAESTAPEPATATPTPQSQAKSIEVGDRVTLPDYTGAPGEGRNYGAIQDAEVVRVTPKFVVVRQTNSPEDAAMFGATKTVRLPREVAEAATVESTATDSTPIEQTPETPAVRQYQRFKRDHPGTVLLMRMGSYYEVFGSDAAQVADTLGLTLAQSGKVPMVGFPSHMLDESVKTLVESGVKVAVAETPKAASTAAEAPAEVSEKKGTASKKPPEVIAVTGDNLIGQFFGDKVEPTGGKAWYDTRTLAGHSRTIPALLRLRSEFGDFDLVYHEGLGSFVVLGQGKKWSRMAGQGDPEITLRPEVFNIDPAKLRDGMGVDIDWDSIEATNRRRLDLVKKSKSDLQELAGLSKGDPGFGGTKNDLADRILLKETKQPQREEGPEARRKTVTERIIAAAEKMETDARAANAKMNIPRGRSSGATLPPAYYANVVKIGAAKIIKGVTKFAEWSAEMLASETDYIKPHLRELWKDSKRLARNIVDGVPPSERVKTTVRRATGQTDESPAVETTERKALRDKLSESEKAAHLAYRSGLRTARDELPAIKASIKEAMKLKADARADTVQGIREEIRRLVEDNLPIEFRGRFLPDITRATSLGALARSVNKLRRESARATGAQDIRQIEHMKRYARLLPRRTPTGAAMSPREAFDAGLQEAIEQADKLKRTGRAVVTVEEIEAAADRLVELKSDMGQAIADAMAAKRVFLAKKRGTAEQHASDLAETIRSRKPITRAGDPSDAATPIVRRGNLQYRDLRNITEALEGEQGTAYALMVRRMQGKHESYLTALRESSEQLDSLAKDAGYKSVADAIAKLSGRRGGGVTETATVRLGGEERTIARGELMALYAMDDSTRARIRQGSPFQISRGRRRKPIHATIEEIDSAVMELSQKERTFVDGLKETIESQRDELFEAHFRLKGYYPETVEGYWPTKRNLRFSPQKGLPEGWRGISERYMENVGFLKEREGGTLPFVVTDALTTAMSHIDATLKVIHLSEATRDAASVMLNPDVTAAINERFGTSYNLAVDDFLRAISLANEADSTTPGRAVQWMNQNLAVGKLGLNPSTWLKQIGGIPRLAAQMPTRAFADGMKGWMKVSTADLTNGSGYFWERYVGNIAGRFTPVGGESYTDVAKATGKLGFEETVANAVSAFQNRSLGDLNASLNSLRNFAATTLQVLNAFDAVNAKIAYAGWLAEAKRKYPAWDEAERAGWAMTRAAESVRETQNSSSVLDAPLVGARARGRGGSAFLVFTSDTFKARNRIEAAARKGKTELARHVAAEALNVIWARGVSWGIGAGVAATVISLVGDDEDWDKWEEKYLALDKQLFYAARDVLSVFDPVVAPELASMLKYRFSSLNAPALDAVNESLRSLLDAGDEALQVLAGDESLDEFVIKLGKAANTIGGAIGVNPIESMMDRTLTQLDAQNENDGQQGRSRTKRPTRKTRERRQRR